MKRTHRLLVLVALALALFTTVPGALAYFTASTSGIAKTRPLTLTTHTNIEEEMKDWEKTAVIRSEAGSAPVFVRVQVFFLDMNPGDPSLDMNPDDDKNPGEWKVTTTCGGAGWNGPQDGWYYWYDDQDKGVLDGSETYAVTTPFTAKIETPPYPKGENPEFDVTIVYETTPVQYDDEGNLLKPWDTAVNWTPAAVPNS